MKETKLYEITNQSYGIYKVFDVQVNDEGQFIRENSNDQEYCVLKMSVDAKASNIPLMTALAMPDVTLLVNDQNTPALFKYIKDIAEAAESTEKLIEALNKESFPLEVTEGKFYRKYYSVVKNQDGTFSRTVNSQGEMFKPNNNIITIVRVDDGKGNGQKRTVEQEVNSQINRIEAAGDLGWVKLDEDDGDNGKSDKDIENDPPKNSEPPKKKFV